MRLLPALALLGLLSAPAAAQAPRITPQGDPTVRDDTLYRLAVDPAGYPEESSILLLDDGVVILEADGTGSRTYRYVAQVLTQQAVEGWAERVFSWDGTRERFRLNWARVVGPDGTVISDRPSHDQESLAPVSQSAPVYTDQKLRRISLGGVKPGVIVDISYTTETVEPVMPRDFLASWSVHTGQTTRRSRYLVEIPSHLEPRIRETNLDFRRKVRRSGGRTVYEWSTAEVPTIEPEPFMADSNDVYMSITMTGPVSWGDVARWYHGLSHDRYALTPAIQARLAEVVRDAGTAEDSLRAVHRWVAQDFRYVSLSLGIGGYQPRTPASVFETQYGDCKDKATLFIALARRLGFRAHPVLLSSGGGVAPEHPSIEQFDHLIAAVERPGGYLFLDLTAELTPFGEIPAGYQGEFGLVVHPDGRGEEIRFPLAPPSANRTETRLVGELSPEGVFAGSLTTSATGGMQYELRDAFSARLSDREREQVTRSIAGSVFEGSTGEGLETFDGRDLRAEPRVSVRIRDARATAAAGGAQILTLPLANYASAGLVSELRSRTGPRRFPIDVAAVVGPHETVSELRVTLPEGWRARLPQGVEATSEFGSYTAEYAQQGRELRVVRRLAGSRGTQPPERLEALIRWLEELSKDDVRFLVLEPPAGK